MHIAQAEVTQANGVVKTTIETNAARLVLDAPVALDGGDHHPETITTGEQFIQRLSFILEFLYLEPRTRRRLNILKRDWDNQEIQKNVEDQRVSLDAVYENSIEVTQQRCIDYGFDTITQYLELFHALKIFEENKSGDAAKRENAIEVIKTIRDKVSQNIEKRNKTPEFQAAFIKAAALDYVLEPTSLRKEPNFSDLEEVSKRKSILQELAKLTKLTQNATFIAKLDHFAPEDYSQIAYLLYIKVQKAHRALQTVMDSFITESLVKTQAVENPTYQAVAGLPASGKSTIIEASTTGENVVVIDQDQWRPRIAKALVEDPLFASLLADVSLDESKQATYHIFSEITSQFAKKLRLEAFKQKRSIVEEGTFKNQKKIDDVKALSEKYGYDFVYHTTKPTIHTCVKNLIGFRHRGVSMVTLFEAVEALLHPAEIRRNMEDQDPDGWTALYQLATALRVLETQAG